MIELILGMAVSLLSGAVIGLVPFFLGRYMGKPGWGRLGWLCSMLAGLLFLSFLVAIAFVVVILVSRSDYNFPQRPARSSGAVPTQPVNTAGDRSTNLGITCLSGPLKGQTYPVSMNGLMIGRDHDCAIRFGSETPGISRHHCSLRWQQGALMLTDLNSAYGTFLADGRKLPPQYPTRVAAGTRFYLADTGYLFQVVITM